MSDPARLPNGLTVDAVDWLPSGARSGLVRVRGRRPEGLSVELPVLRLDEERFASLPDPRGGRDPVGWRGAYVVDAALAAAAQRWVLEWPGGAALVVERPAVAPSAAPAPSEPEDEGAGGEVVDRAVLAERRARRAEAAEQAQARIAREALRAVEVLELRAVEIEERLSRAEVEREALRQQLAARAAERAAPPPPADPAPVERALRDELANVRAELARRDAAPPAALGDPDRRAARLRDALTATVGTVAELRLQLHEAQVARRTREVEWSAEAVRLTVLERERAAQDEALAAARAELEAARAAEAAASAALDEARAAAAGAAAAHDETRRRFAERVGELREARERIAALEAEVAAVRAETHKSAQEAAQAAEEAAEARARTRVEEVEAQAAARIAAIEESLAVAEGQLAHALASIDELETARELAEARAVAAEAARRAAEVAQAAGAPPPAPADPFAAARARLQEPVPDEAATPAPLPAASESAAGQVPSPAPPPAPPEVLARAAEQVRAAAERPPDGNGQDQERLVADLEAAAEALRRRATIVSATREPPGDVVRGRAGREYPLLRGALVKLAHDDPVAAARLIAGLLPAQHAVLEEPVDYDLTLRELGTFAISAGAGGSLVAPVLAPRGRRRAAFHVRSDALTVAEWLAGVGPRPRRLGGRLRVSGAVRRARALELLRDTRLPLNAAVRAGAVLDPVLALRCLSYAVHPSWTRGHDAVVRVEVGDARADVAVGDGTGIEVTAGQGARPADATIRMAPSALSALLAGEPDPALDVEGDRAAADALRGWADRARGW